MLEVLWIDDECKTESGSLTAMGVEFVEYAQENDIKITPMLTYKEGIEAIENNPHKWCAVILDIHNQKATTYDPSEDFAQACKDIMRFQVKNNNQEEPYVFVLSGNKRYNEESAPIGKPKYCSKKIYDKNNGDYKILFEDIKRIKDVSPLYRCQNKYSDVLINAKRFCGDETYKSVLRILYRIDVLDIKNEASLLNDIRKILEEIMGGLKESGYSYFTETKEKESLNKLSEYLGKDGDVPEYIKRSFHSLVRVVQNGSHSMVVDNDVKNFKAPYLLRSSLYELCNILIWLSAFDKR